VLFVMLMHEQLPTKTNLLDDAAGPWLSSSGKGDKAPPRAKSATQTTEGDHDRSQERLSAQKTLGHPQGTWMRKQPEQTALAILS